MSRELEGEMILLDVPSATYFSLNETGTQVWSLLQAHATVEKVCDEVARKHSLPAEQMMSDLIPFLEQLLDAGLIQIDG